jgi:hypothetical protein
VREFPKGRLELVKIGGATIGRAVFEPGWRWATSLQPIVKTKSCDAPHFQYHVSGVLRIRMDDGREFDCGPGDVSLLPSGHDAWVVGNEPAVVVDFQGMLDYAKSPSKKRPARALPHDRRAADRAASGRPLTLLVDGPASVRRGGAALDSRDGPLGSLAVPVW